MFSNIRSAAAWVFGASPKQKRKATAPPEPPEGNRRVLRRRVVPEEVYHGRKGRSSAEGADADERGSSEAGHPNTHGRASRRRGGREVGDDEMEPSTSKVPAKPCSPIARSPWELEDVGLDVMCLLRHAISECSPQDAANAALVSSRWREMMGPRPAVTSALQRIGNHSCVGEVCLAMRHLISLPKKEAKEWLLKERRFSRLTDLICAEDDLARALALQVLAIVRRNLGEGTVSDLLENVIDHFAHLEFTKGESTVQDASARIRFIANLVQTLCMRYPSAIARRLFEMLLEPKEERDWNLHHLAVPYASKALLMIIERNPKEMARYVHLVRDLLTVTEHSWLEKRELRLGPSEIELERSCIPDQVSVVRAAGITLIATFGKSAKEHLPTVAELLRDQRVVAPGNQSIAPDGIIAYGRDVTISMLAGQILGSQFITLPMARGFLPVVAAMLNDVDLNARIAALRTLGRLAGRGAEAHVSDMVDRLEDTSSVARCEAIEALVSLEPSAVRPHAEAIGRRLWDPDRDVYASAVIAMGWFGKKGLASEVHPDHINELVNLLEVDYNIAMGAVIPTLNYLKHLLHQSHVDQILQYIDDETRFSIAIKAIEVFGKEFFVRRGAIEFLLRKAEDHFEFEPEPSLHVVDAMCSLAGSMTDEIFKTSFLNRLKSIETAKSEDDLRPWAAATYMSVLIRGKTAIKRRTAEQAVTLMSHIFKSPHATDVHAFGAGVALKSQIARIAKTQTVRMLVNLLRDLSSVACYTGDSRAKKEKAEHAERMLMPVLTPLLPAAVSWFQDEYENEPENKLRPLSDLPGVKGVKKKEVYPLLEEFVSAVCTAIKLAFKRGAVPPALQASDCLCDLNCVKDERHRSVVAGTINTILPLLLGRGKDEGVREVSSDQRVQEYLAPQYMEILRWNASVVTPKHVKDIIGSIKMPFSRSSSLRLNCSKMRVVMRAIEGMSEGQAQPLVDKIVEKFAPWKSTTRCWRAGVWMIRVLATCPPGCSVSHADTFKKYMMTCLNPRGLLQREVWACQNFAWAMLVIADAKVAEFKASMDSSTDATDADTYISDRRLVPRNIFREDRRGDAIAPLFPSVVDKWLMGASDHQKMLGKIILHRLKPQALKQFFRHRVPESYKDYFEKTRDVDVDKQTESFLRRFDPEHDMNFDDDEEWSEEWSESVSDPFACDCPNCVSRRANPLGVYLPGTMDDPSDLSDSYSEEDYVFGRGLFSGYLSEESEEDIYDDEYFSSDDASGGDWEEYSDIDMPLWIG